MPRSTINIVSTRKWEDDPSSQSLTKRYEQYMRLARETAQAGNRIEAENLYQHAEHYYRTAVLQKVSLQQ